MSATEPEANKESQGNAAQHGGDKYKIVRDLERSQYEILDGDTSIGYAQYRESPGSIAFTHTVIDGAYGGLGLGSRIARQVLDDALKSDLRIVPECSFIAAYLRKHHEYDANVEWPVPDAGA